MQMSAGQENLKNDVHSGQEEMKNDIHNNVSAIQNRMSTGQAEFGEGIVDTIDRQLKAVTAMVGQTQKLHEVFNRKVQKSQ
jgi:hypothetical protein